ncbi:MAG: carbohydrate binding domain-containing protein [Ruminococcus sp.]|uniref:carbohydrate binding domain-containing protein n=1 Tax=Ruminococcus sp. TaxID=41978 RepID=UPI0025D9CBEB|nr:carbohydrate binding domain-containing protein [Ruminococcus sp.]MCR4796139.1 carbohydrate binding domain-containing protein [Ruminococcus sp.]
MKHSTIMGKVLSVVTASALLFAGVTILPENSAIEASAAGAAVIDTTDVYQTIRGFGGINLPEWISQGDMTDSQVQKAFGNGADELGFTILRIYVSDDNNAWSRAVPTAKRAQALGATVFATPWNPPADIRNTVNGGLQGGKYQLKKDKWAEYAQHLNSYCKYMEGQGIDLYSISIQNEPDYASEWTYWSASDLASFTAQYGKAVKEGTNVKLMSPESFQYKKDIYNAILGNQQAMANTDLFGTHFYGTQRSQMDFPALENCGKDIWMTEVYVPNSEADSNDRWPEGLQVAENIHNGLVVGNLNAYVWWYIRRNYGPLKENGTISKRGYAMAQYSKWVRPGAKRIGVTEQPNTNVLVSAYKNTDGNVAVVAINKNNAAVNQEFTMGSGETVQYVDSYTTSSTANISKKELTANGTSFSASLPAQSVTTFVLTTEGEGVDPSKNVDENGYFFHDTYDSGTNSWLGRGAASVESTTSEKLSGNGSLAVSGRTASWNGAVKSLSARTFVPGNVYSFAANVKYNSGPAEQTFQLSLQYSDGTTTLYDHIASVTVPKGEWVQLANKSYTIPAGATDLQLYVETDDTDTDYISFFIDEAIGAPEGTDIAGAEPPKPFILGDVNSDEIIDSLDMIAARKAILAGNYVKAADVDKSGKFEVNDLVALQAFILGKITAWPEPETPPAPQVDTSKWYNYQETATAQYIDFYESSIKHMGNTYRLAQKLTAAENGESLTVAYLGGSITEGKNYTTPFSNYLKNTFAKGSFKEVNAGLSGTSSVVGLVRSEKDIVSQKPDIIFLEFSVNDHEDIMYKKCFESCIKKFLDMPNEPAVCVLITRARGGFSSQAQMYPIGKNFDIPVISMDDALTKAFNSKFLQTSDYYTDDYHPHQKGGQLVADCMAYYVRQALKSKNQSTGYTQPTSYVYGAEYANCVNVNPKDLNNFNAGSWTAGTGYNSLPYSYTLNGSNPMKFKTEGKGLIIVFKANSSGMGSINVTVNGKTTKVNGNKQYTWGGPDAELGYYQDTTGELDVSISGSGSFTIWGIGLVK